MQLDRSVLTVLFNALYDTGDTTITVAHPAEEIGELMQIDLTSPLQSEVRLNVDRDTYTEQRNEVDRLYGSVASDELPEPRSYASAFVGGGLLDPANQAEIQTFLEQNGGADLTAGHRPVFAGFDTNLMAWRPADVLGLEPGHEALVNGFALASGVRDELTWDHKQSNTRPLEDAFGPEFGQLWNQPSGANREGRLGVNYYRRLRDHRYAEEVVTDQGDEAIVQGYDEFQRETGRDVLLFSNDRDFIERARTHRIRAQRVEFPQNLPRKLTGSWLAIQNTLYLLTVLFGVLKLPKVTLHGVWKGKGGTAWHDEALKVECRSPKLEPLIERDLAILDAHCAD